MATPQRFEEYLKHLSRALGHKDRIPGLRDYCTSLLQPLERKNALAMAARIDPVHVTGKHQALHHFVSSAQWSDAELLRRVAQWVVPTMDLSRGGWWVVGYAAYPKRGSHSVGVARQRCGASEKAENCQVAVSVSLACEHGSLPLAWQLYLPQVWVEDGSLRRKTGVPDHVGFATKTQIALEQIEALIAAGEHRRPVFVDVECSPDSAFRQALSDLGLRYVAGITADFRVWLAENPPAHSAQNRGAGRPPSPLRFTQERAPMSARAVALALPAQAFQTVSWREGGGRARIDRFAAVRVRHASGYAIWAQTQPPQWLLMKWQAGEPEPTEYWLSTLPEDTPVDQLVAAAHQRWRCELDHQALKQEFGLDHYEGRGWRGFHHHATLCIASYGFALSERLSARQPQVLAETPQRMPVEDSFAQ